MPDIAAKFTAEQTGAYREALKNKDIAAGMKLASGAVPFNDLSKG
jgi:hypothetical protein